MLIDNKFQIVNIGHIYSRSGTLYLHSLLDSHPEIITIPGVVNFNFLFRKQFKTVDSVIKKFEEANPKFYDTSKLNYNDQNSSFLWRLGNKMNDKILINKKKFRLHFKKYIKEFKNMSTKNLIISIYLAYSKSRNINLKKKKIILMHPHELNICIEYSKIFKNSKFIFPVRDPIQTYYSILVSGVRKAQKRNQFYYPLVNLVECQNSFDFFKKSKVNFYSFKFENLKKKKLMIKICKYLNIKMHPNLNKSTFGGYKYWGNSPQKRSKFLNNKNNEYNKASEREKLSLVIIHYKTLKILKYKNYYKYFKKINFFSILYLMFPLKEELYFIKQFKFKNTLKYLSYLKFYVLNRFQLLLNCYKEKY